MSTFYIKPVTGNDSLDGTSWDSAWSTWSGGPTAARIAPGDTIRIQKSPDPTLVGNAQWTSGPLPGTKSIVSSTNTSPIRLIVTNHGYDSTDVVYVHVHEDNTGANGYWFIDTIDSSSFNLTGSIGVATGGATGSIVKANARVVLLDNPVTATITTCDSSTWVTMDAGKVTCSRDILYQKEGHASAKFAIDDSAGVEKLAYVTTDNTTLNLSGYKQVSFMAWSTAAIASGDLSLRLCSDLTGGDTVNTINIPAVVASDRQWCPYTVDTGTGLGTSIRSIALYQTVDNGAFNFYLDNIIACKDSSSADSLSLTSLITKNSDASGGGNEGHWGIKSIKDRIVVLDKFATDGPSIGKGYYGDTTNTATYKRECFRETLPSSAGVSPLQLMENGTPSNRNKIEGGWGLDGTRNGCTFYDGGNGFGRNALNAWNWDITRINLVRYGWGLSAVTGFYNTWKETNTIGNCSRSIYVEGAFNTFDVKNILSNEGAGIFEYYSVKNTYNVKNIFGSETAVYLNGPQDAIYNVDEICNNTTGIYAVSLTNPIAYFSGTHTKDNPSGGVLNYGSHNMHFYNALADDDWIISGYQDYAVYSQKHQRIEGNHVILLESPITLQSAVSLTGTAWEMSATTIRSLSYPMRLKLVRISVTEANKLITITTNIKLGNQNDAAAKVYIRGRQIGGIDSDLSFAAPSDTAWNTVTATLTPTTVGCFEVEVWGWCISNNTGLIYVDSTVNVTQAP